MSNNKHLKFLRQWLIHLSLFWAILNITRLFSYWLRVQTEGNYLIKPDGTYVTLWDRFISFNYNQDNVFVVLSVTFLAELGFHYIFGRTRIIFFIFYSILTAVLWVLYPYLVKERHDYLLFPAYLQGMLFVAAYTFFYALVRDFFRRRAQEARIVQFRQEAELRELKAQVNPHFFFNTLNSIYGLSLEENAGRTSKALEKLADMMRYTMSSAAKTKASLKEELNFVENYIQLQKIRLGDEPQIDLTIRLEPADQERMIAPLLLIPFIENSFQYGISRTESSYVRLLVTVTNGQLTMNLENSISQANRVHGHGTGIANTKRRLEILYPEHELRVNASSTSYEVFLRINLSH